MLKSGKADNQLIRSPSPKGLDCILMESGAPQTHLLLQHAKLCLPQFPDSSEHFHNSLLLFYLASSAPHASPTWQKLQSLFSVYYCLTTRNYFTEFSMDIMPLAPMKKCCEIKPLTCYSCASDVQKSLSCFTSSFYVGTKGMFASTSDS